jgi:hypothetical protein
MIAIKTLSRPSIEIFNSSSICLYTDTWEEELQELLDSVEQEPEDPQADPDRQAASRFLMRHCREALQARQSEAARPFRYSAAIGVSDPL